MSINNRTVPALFKAESAVSGENPVEESLEDEKSEQDLTRVANMRHFFLSFVPFDQICSLWSFWAARGAAGANGSDNCQG